MDHSLDSTSLAIQRALLGLLGREEDGDFVVFTAVGSEKSLLFANDGGKIRLDFPVEGLAPNEADRAQRFFNAMGESLKVHYVFDARHGEPAGQFMAYQMDLGDKVEAGAFLAIDIFLKVFDLPRDFAITVEENE